ncbi:MAG: uncharacterized protein KVP18_002929 [Porospora cf. gigantea A]|uniref:uncharacterized protein n=1 Tax=Porospora cf. gigantea A TaxID=2853593 RepID=UPI00355A450E|nr:MAG: hypothetical protein KVP18_002929 [Porospora cf. gigantea A]
MLSLPVDGVKEEFLWAVETHRVVVVVAEPGSGKSTRLPQFLWNAGWAQGGMIAMTSPRRSAAVMVANRIAEERQAAVGREIGYMMRFASTVDREACRLCVATEGRLLMETLSDPLLARISVLILDDAHERSLEGDLLMVVLKRIMSVRKNLRLVICSATLETEEILKFFKPADVEDFSAPAFRTEAVHGAEFLFESFDDARQESSSSSVDAETAMRVLEDFHQKRRRRRERERKRSPSVKLERDDYGRLLTDDRSRRRRSSERRRRSSEPRRRSSEPRWRSTEHRRRSSDPRRRSSHRRRSPEPRRRRSPPARRESPWPRRRRESPVASQPIRLPAPETLADLHEVFVLNVMNSQPHPLALSYADHPPADYLEAVVEAVLEVHMSEPRGDILAFLTGKEEVTWAANKLNEMEAHRMRQPGQPRPRLLVQILHGELPVAMQLQAVRAGRRRRVLVATNIAEASLTVQGVQHVVDCMYTKVKADHPVFGSGLQVLSVLPASAASLAQRAGRAARLGPGKAIRVGSAAADIPSRNIPEIARVDLSQTVLFLMRLGITNFAHLQFPSPLPKVPLRAALTKLHALGLIDGDARLTQPLGAQVAVLTATLKLSVEMAAFLAMSVRFNCTVEAASICAMTLIDSPWLPRPPTFGVSSKVSKYDLSRGRLQVHQGDFVSLFNVRSQWLFYRDDDSDFCRDHFLREKELVKADVLHDRVCRTLDSLKVPPVSCGEDVVQVQRTLCSSLFLHAAQHCGGGIYRPLRPVAEASLNPEDGRPMQNFTLALHPSSSLYGRNPPYVVFARAVATQSAISLKTSEAGSLEELESRVNPDKMSLVFWMHGVTPVEPKWLLETAGGLFMPQVN